MIPQAFIAGLSRSRTYWLSQYFDSHDGVKAYHELSMTAGSPEKFAEAMEADPCVVDADVMLVITDYKERWPSAPLVYVERDLEDSLNSTIRYLVAKGGKHNRVDVEKSLYAGRDYYREHADITIPYLKLDERLPEIHEAFNIPYSEETHATWACRNLSRPKIAVKRKTITMWDAAQGVTR